MPCSILKLKIKFPIEIKSNFNSNSTRKMLKTIYLIWIKNARMLENAYVHSYPFTSKHTRQS